MSFDIYNMKLHDYKQLGGVQIMRVPGGWIYNFVQGGEVFVPFDNEFQKQ